MAIHRIIEAHAAAHGDAPAILNAGITLSYRELNQRANAVARHLIDNGFRRGSLATVRLPRSVQTAVVLLGILKAGGKYVLLDDDRAASSTWPHGVSFADGIEGEEFKYRTVDVVAAVERSTTSLANLPILSRASDVACVLTDGDGAPRVQVPHSTIMALQNRVVPRFAQWSGEPGAFDLWVALMTGATVTLGGASLQSVAA